MTIFENRYKAKKALNAKNSKLKYSILKYNNGFIVACGLLTL